MSAMSPSPRLTSIVAVDRNGAIGCRNSLPWKLKTDMSFFRQATTGQSVIMGRKTYDSIGCPLKGRKNIVLSHNWQLFDSTPDCKLAHSIPESLAQAYQNRSREVFIIGGAATYLEFAPLVDRYLITVVDCEVPDADAFLATEIRDELSGWGSVLISSVAASPDADEHSFKIYEIETPDSDERADVRQHLISSFLIKKQKAPTSRVRGQSANTGPPQIAFAF